MRTGPLASSLKLTHPERVLFPDPGITKRELAAYWETVADFALPHMRERPLTVRRCPKGYDADCFYQKHVGTSMPSAVPRVQVKEGEQPYVMVDGPEALRGLVQIAALELHVWGSRVAHLDRPDILVFDFDPAPDVSFREVATATRNLRARLQALGLVPFVRVTGGKGLHVVVPVVPGPSWPVIKRFARAVVDEMVRDEPDRFIATASKAHRKGKIFIDYLRNDQEATAVASYSPRARAGAPVAMPVEWEALNTDTEVPPRFLLRDALKHITRRPRDPWGDFAAARRSLTP